MSRPLKAPPAEVDRIKRLWEKKGRPNAAQLLEKDRLPSGEQRHGERLYQRCVSEARKKAKEAPEDPELVPWGEGWPTNPEAIECLFRLRKRYVEYSGTLTVRFAKWVLRLRKLFPAASLAPGASRPPHPDAEEEEEIVFESDRPESDIDRYLAVWASEYAQRERACEVLGIPLYTADLDGALTFRPWESLRSAEEYQAAVVAGLVPAYEGNTPNQFSAALYGWEHTIRTTLLAMTGWIMRAQTTNDEHWREQWEAWIARDSSALGKSLDQCAAARKAFNRVVEELLAPFSPSGLSPDDRERLQHLVEQIQTSGVGDA